MDVKTLCLGILAEQDRTGYEIKRYCEEVFRHFFLAGFGSIYPALAELRRAGLVRLTGGAQPSATRQGRPDKKVYGITPAGRSALAAELLATVPSHKVRSSFLTLMYFAHLMPPEAVDQKLGQMIQSFEATVEGELASFGANEAWRDLTPGQRFALGYGRTVLGAALAYCREQRPLLAQALREAAPAAVTGVTDAAADAGKPESGGEATRLAEALAGE